MLAFNVVKERHGWAVRVCDQMTTPFWSRDLAIREAVSLAEAIRRHGQFAEVIVEGVRAKGARPCDAALTAPRPEALVRRVTPY